MTTETKHTKNVFSATEGEKLNSSYDLLRSLAGYHEIDDKTLDTIGRPQKDGIVIFSPREVVSTIKHPKLIMSSYDLASYDAEFYGQQTEKQIETSMAKVMGMEYAQVKSQKLIDSIKREGLNNTYKHAKFGTIGMEDEGWHFTPEGLPYDLPGDEQVEVQSHAREVALDPPSPDPIQQALALAVSRLNEAAKRSENLVTNTSFSMLGTPTTLNPNMGDYVKYVLPVTANMVKRNIFDPQDPLAKEAWDKIAQKDGIEDFYDLKEKVGNLSPLAFAAAHVSLGLRHENGGDNLRIGIEEGIAVSDIINSNLGTVLEWMTYSTPIAFGDRVGVNINGETKYARDARAILRLASKTAYPGDFIKDPETLRHRLIDSIYTGKADRIDRAAYTAKFDDIGEEVAAAHGRVRFRQTNGSGKEPFTKTLGRVEFTGGPNTPDIMALTSRNAMFQLMGIAAYEATANGQHPADYFVNYFPNLSKCDEHIELAHAYNFVGSDHPKVAALIQEAKAFVGYMRKNYPHKDTQLLADLAEYGIDRITQKTEARNLEQFLENPKGNISDVMVYMMEDGYTTKEIAKAVAKYESDQAKMIIFTDGDLKKLILN